MEERFQRKWLRVAKSKPEPGQKRHKIAEGRPNNENQ
jgi:hypothetical protein